MVLCYNSRPVKKIAIVDHTKRERCGIIVINQEKGGNEYEKRKEKRGSFAADPPERDASDLCAGGLFAPENLRLRNGCYEQCLVLQ